MDPKSSPAPPPQTTYPSFFANIGKPRSHGRSNTNPTLALSTLSTTAQQEVTNAQIVYKEMAAAFYMINSKYRISWQCADLLIELCGGAGDTNAMSTPPDSSYE